jgi:NADPH-dependent 2,4-dienoyl-CoA reductase/sulfur reductase-like enzyme
MKYVIIGGGIAGVEAALEIRRRDRDGMITILDMENEARGKGCIYRPALKEFLSGSLSDSTLSVYPSGYLQERGITFLHAGVSSIDPSSSTIHFISIDQPNTTQAITYDSLLLATGAVPRTPDVFHHDPAPENQFYFKFLEDAVHIRGWLENHTGACCVVGSGVLGLETAELLTGMGHDVIMLTRSDNRLFRGIPDGLKSKLNDLFQRKGVRTHRFDEVREIPFREGRFTRLNLKDGTSIPIDTVILCAGVDVVRMLPVSAELDFSRGIHVDEHMRTSDQNIFAAGDCAFLPWAPGQHGPETLRLWEPSRRMGKVAGANMAGGDETFDPWPMYYHTLLFDIPLGFFGSFDAPEEGHERIVRQTDDGYREIVLSKENGRIMGASFLGGRPVPPPRIRIMKKMRDGEKLYLDPKLLLEDTFDQESLWYL